MWGQITLKFSIFTDVILKIQNIKFWEKLNSGKILAYLICNTLNTSNQRSILIFDITRIYMKLWSGWEQIYHKAIGLNWIWLLLDQNYYLVILKKSDLLFFYDLTFVVTRFPIKIIKIMLYRITWLPTSC